MWLYYLVRKAWDSGGVLWLENNPKFIFSSGIQHPNIILVSTNIIEREDFSEPPCCFYEGIVSITAERLPSRQPKHSTSWIWRFLLSLASSSAPWGPQEWDAGIPNSWDASKASARAWQMWFRTRCTSAPFRRGSWRLGRRPWDTWKASRHLHLDIWVILLVSMAVKVTLLGIFWANLNVHWVRPLWCMDMVCGLGY